MSKDIEIDEMDRADLAEWYTLVPDPDDVDADYWCVRLDKGDFKGMIYKYGPVGISSKLNKEGTLPIKFEWDVLFLPEEIRKMEFPDAKKSELEHLMGNIMMGMVQDNMDSAVGLSEDDPANGLSIKKTINTEGFIGQK
jgi:hypothetical protein